MNISGKVKDSFFIICCSLEQFLPSFAINLRDRDGLDLSLSHTASTANSIFPTTWKVFIRELAIVSYVVGRLILSILLSVRWASLFQEPEERA